MCNEKCGASKCGGCCVKKTAKVLLIIGGLNWGFLGVGMMMGNNDFNVVHIVLQSIHLSSPIIEGLVYVLVGLAAVIKFFGCCCKKSKAACASCAVEGKTEEKTETKM